MKVSFDFDGTLEHLPKQEYAKELIQRGVEVWITTSRFGDPEKYKEFFETHINIECTNRDLYEISDRVGIPRERIFFTNMENKWNYLKDKDFIWHIDDDWAENRMILNHTKIKAIDAHTSSWKTKCERLIKRAEKANK